MPRRGYGGVIRVPVPERVPATERVEGRCARCGKAIQARAMTPQRWIVTADRQEFGPYCTPCRKRFVAGLERAAKNGGRYRNNYGLLLTEYGRIYAEQHGVCAICQSKREPAGALLVVDHDHDTEEVRGLLCGRCNTGIGMFRDDPALLAAAIVYVTTRLPLHLTQSELDTEAG